MPLRLLAFLLAVVCGLVACADGTTAGTQIVGTWELQSRVVTGSDGVVIADPVLGLKPLGRLFYSAGGRMALQMMRLDRTAAIGETDTAEDADNPRIVLGYDAYFGRYTINESDNTITHHVEGSLFPEDLGRDFTRRFRLDGDTFELSFESGEGEAAIRRVLAFRRAR